MTTKEEYLRNAREAANEMERLAKKHAMMCKHLRDIDDSDNYQLVKK